MNEIIYISFTCSHHIGVRKKNDEQIKVWNTAGYSTFVINDLCDYGYIIKILYRYFIFTRFFIFNYKPRSKLYIRQTVSLPLFGFISRFRSFSYEVNADIMKESKTLGFRKKIIFYFLSDALMKNAEKVFFVSYELESRYKNHVKQSFVFPNCVKNLQMKKKLPRGNKIVFVGNEEQKWQGVDILFELAKVLPMFQFHIIGNVLSIPDFANIDNLKLYGVLTGQDYERVMAEVDYSIGTLAFYRSGISEGSALKVRDYVSYDLPIIAGYKDSDFSQTPFYFQIGKGGLNTSTKEDIIKFCEEWKYKSVHDYIDRSCICKNRELLRIKLIFDES